MSKIIVEDKRLTDNLRKTAKEYVALKADRRKTAKKLYETFLKKLVFQYEKDTSVIAKELKSFFGKDKIRVLAVDGTMNIQRRRGVIVFYALASPLLYELDLSGSTPKYYRIEESSIRHSVMIMIPVPLSEIYNVGQTSVETDADRDEGMVEENEEELTQTESDILDKFLQPRKMGKIDLSLMKLAEVYTVEQSLTTLSPDVVMIDGSVSEMYAYTNRNPDEIYLHNGDVLGLKTMKHDYTILKSMPSNTTLLIPSTTNLRQFVTAEIIEDGKITIDSDSESYSWNSKLAGKTLKLSKREIEKLTKVEYLEYSQNGSKHTFQLKEEYKGSLKRLETIYRKVCEEGFDKNNLDAFRIYIPEGEKSYVYMGEAEIQTIARIGFDMIFKTCWEKNVLLFSVTKDSYVRFFIDNFLAIGGEIDKTNFDLDLDLLPRVPSTDGGVLYDITVGDQRLNTPLTTTEFDTAISTIYRKYNPITKNFSVERIGMVAQERQFLRSIVQVAQDTQGRKSYSYTVDRITYPQHDKNYDLLDVTFGSKTHRFMYYKKPSLLSKVIVDLLFVMSSNKHDAVFGYPDPLFEVDQYVKTVGLTHYETLDLALTEVDLDEFSISYREGRQRGGG